MGAPGAPCQTTSGGPTLPLARQPLGALGAPYKVRGGWGPWGVVRQGVALQVLLVGLTPCFFNLQLKSWGCGTLLRGSLLTVSLTP